MNTMYSVREGDLLKREHDDSNTYVVINEMFFNRLWLVCYRGEARLGEAIRLDSEEFSASKWVLHEISAFIDEVSAYEVTISYRYETFEKLCDYDGLADKIDAVTDQNLGDEVDFAIKKKMMKRENYLRDAGKWDKIYDILRVQPDKFHQEFLKRLSMEPSEHLSSALKKEKEAK